MFENFGKRKRARARDSVPGAVISAAAHCLAIVLLVWAGRTGAFPLLGTGERAEGWGTGPTDGPAGGGGGGNEVVTFYDIQTAAPASAMAEVEEEAVVVEPVPEPEPVEEPEDLVVPPIEAPMAIPEVGAVPVTGAPTVGEMAGAAGSPGSGPGTGPGSGGGSGGGIGGGIGSGEGPGTGGGVGEGGIRPPVPTAVILPPPPPNSVRGTTVTLRLTVDAQGRVRDVELDRPTGDRSFESRLRRTAMDWRFEPARDATNRAVAAQTEVSFSF